MGLASGAAAALARTASADDLEPPGRAHARGVPHRRRTAARADARPLVHVVEPRPAVGVRRRLRHLPLPRGRLAAAPARRQRGRCYRTVLWVAGLALLFWVTCGPVNAYQDYLFSMHMVGHMLLTMAIPLLLVAGAPVTLAARAITQARRRHARRTRVDPLGGALTGRPRADEPVRGGRAVHRIALGLLLHRPVPLVAVRPPGARVDDGALPHHRLPVRADPHRHRPGALPPALRGQAGPADRASWRCTPSSASRS